MVSDRVQLDQATTSGSIGQSNSENEENQATKEVWVSSKLATRLKEIESSAQTLLSISDTNFIAAVFLSCINAIPNDGVVEGPDLDKEIQLKFGNHTIQCVYRDKIGIDSCVSINSLKLDLSNKALDKNLIYIQSKMFYIHIQNSVLRAKPFDAARVDKSFMEDSDNPPQSLKARWAEENRPTKQVKLRLDPTLIERIEHRAKSQGKNRTEWITDTLKRALDLS